MSVPVIGRQVVRLGVVDSTMDEAAVLADAGAPEGMVVVAEYQAAGRGRSGRVWQAPPGTSLLLSVLLRPTVPLDRLSTLPLAAAVAVAEAIDGVMGEGPSVRLKWPNDLWLDEQKVGGILLVARSAAHGLPRAILGVGVNVNVDPQDLPPAATSLSASTGMSVDREVLLNAVLHHLDAAYGAWQVDAGASATAAWTRRAALVGEAVTVEVSGRQRRGVMLGIDDDGALLLDGEGEVERIVSGDVVRGPRRLHDSPPPQEQVPEQSG